MARRPPPPATTFPTTPEPLEDGHAAGFDLHRTLTDLEALTGMGIALHNPYAQLPRLTARHEATGAERTKSHTSDFCEKIKSTKVGTDACMACCARKAQQLLGEQKRPLQWRCQAGLEEVLVPVLVRGEHVATLYGGQARSKKLTAEERKTLRAHWKSLGHDPDEVETIMKRQPLAEPVRMQALARLLGALAEQIATRASTLAITRAIEAQKRTPVDKALALMVEHLDSPLSLEEIAQRVHLSPSRLSHLFTEAEGESYRDRLLRMRIERARQLLTDTALAVGEVGRRVGYSDPNFFSRIFREKAGQSPRAYRRAHATA